MGCGSTLADDIRHVEQFGPELVVETAARYLSVHDLAELRAHIASKERTHRFRHGRWEPRPERARRACALCGLDLPVAARANTRFHRHCQKTAESRGRRARERAAESKDTSVGRIPPAPAAQPRPLSLTGAAASPPAAAAEPVVA